MSRPLRKTVESSEKIFSSTSVDTLTTRFMILFLFLLAIPLTTIIIFTTTLITSYSKEKASEQLLQSQQLFNTYLNYNLVQLSNEKKRIGYTYEKDLLNNPCPSSWVDLCFVKRTAGTIVQNNQYFSKGASAKFLSSLTHVALGSGTGYAPLFFKTESKELLLLSRTGDLADNKGNTSITLGVSVDSTFLNHLNRQYPGLASEIWVLTYSKNGQVDRYITHSSPKTAMFQLSSLLSTIPRLKGVPEVVTVGSQKVYLLKQSLFSPGHQRVADVLYVLPLDSSQILLQKYHFGIVVIGLASFIFSLLLALVVSRSITQPIISLIQELNTISHVGLLERSGVIVSEVRSRGVKEIQQVCQAFNRLIVRLQQEQTMKDEFVATLTHDLKVPLLAEKQTVAYFLDEAYGDVSADQAEVLKTLLASNRSTLLLVNGLLEVYRYDTGKVSLVTETFNLLLLLQETVEALRPLAQEKSIQLSIIAPEQEEQLLAYADRLEIKRVLNNLIANAIMNTHVHGVVYCSVKLADAFDDGLVQRVSHFELTSLQQPVLMENNILLSIQDSGIGFSKEDFPTLFKRFATSKNRGPMSIGLGLYNCYQVIMLHQGYIWVESTEGEGTAVSFILPKTYDRSVFHDRRR